MQIHHEAAPEYRPLRSDEPGYPGVLRESDRAVAPMQTDSDAHLAITLLARFPGLPFIWLPKDEVAS